MGFFQTIIGIFSTAAKKTRQQSIYDFEAKGIDGSPVSFNQYKGKHLIIVNTASRCGYTAQYADLQKLHELHGDEVVVLGFPANDFLWQEPAANNEIADFCQVNFGVTFQIFEKIRVRGRTPHPVYRWLADVSGHKPSWNFCKYWVNKNGEVTGFYGPKISPLDQKILQNING